MTDPRIEQSLAEIYTWVHEDEENELLELKLAAWHARAMKLANEMEHYGHTKHGYTMHYPAMCAKCRLLALLGDLK